MSESPKKYGGYTLEQLKELDRNATAGPWTTERPKADPSSCFANGVIVAAVARGQGIYADPLGGSYPERDRTFIAASRSALPALIEEIERLRKALLEIGLHLSSFLPDTGTPDVSGAARVVRSALSDTTGEEGK